MWYNMKAVQAQGGSEQEVGDMYEHASERLQATVAKLSGNMASTVRDAQGRLSQVRSFDASPVCIMVDLQQVVCVCGCVSYQPAQL